MLEIHDAEWEEGKVGTAGCFGAIFISKIVPQENQKRTLYPCLTLFYWTKLKGMLCPVTTSSFIISKLLWTDGNQG